MVVCHDLNHWDGCAFNEQWVWSTRGPFWCMRPPQAQNACASTSQTVDLPFIRCVYEPFQTGASQGFLSCSLPDLTCTGLLMAIQWHNKHFVFLSDGFGSISCVFGLFRAADCSCFCLHSDFFPFKKRSLQTPQLPLSLSILAQTFTSVKL